MSKQKFIFLLIGITFITYFASFSNPFIWDDEQLIVSNQYVQQFDIEKIFTTNIDAGAGVRSNYYRPFTSLTYAIDTKIWGTNVFGFHAFNTFVHIAAGVLLFLLLLEIGIGEWPSFFLSLIFLIHPIQTEAVVYINSRSDSLFTALLFGSLLLFQKALSKRDTKGYLYAGVLFILSILSKETAIAGFTLYPGLLGLDFLRKKHSLKKVFISYKVPIVFIVVLGLLSMGYILLRLTILNFLNTLNFYSSQTEYSKNLAIRLFTFAHVVWIYIGLLLWPHLLHMERSIDVVRSITSPWVASLIVFIFGLILVGIWELKKKRTAYIFFGLLISASLLAPVSGIIPISGILYEHWLYVPMIGFFIILWRIGDMVIKMIHFDRLIRILSIIFLSVVCMVYSILTIQQNTLWSDPIVFYRYTLSFSPWSARLHNNLGMALISSGKAKEAIYEYKKALALNTNYPQIYNNLGDAYLTLGKYHEAEQFLLKALELSPEFSVARINLIKVYIDEKNFSKAKDLAKGDNELLHEIELLQQQSIN